MRSDFFHQQWLLAMPQDSRSPWLPLACRSSHDNPVLSQCVSVMSLDPESDVVRKVLSTPEGWGTPPSPPGHPRPPWDRALALLWDKEPGQPRPLYLWYRHQKWQQATATGNMHCVLITPWIHRDAHTWTAFIFTAAFEGTAGFHFRLAGKEWSYYLLIISSMPVALLKYYMCYLT